jgi:hypothetical protein
MVVPVLTLRVMMLAVSAVYLPLPKSFNDTAALLPGESSTSFFMFL